MPITFHPHAGVVLICDFSTGFQPPEMVKRRHAGAGSRIKLGMALERSAEEILAHVKGDARLPARRVVQPDKVEIDLEDRQVIGVRQASVPMSRDAAGKSACATPGRFLERLRGRRVLWGAWQPLGRFRPATIAVCL